MKDLSNITWGVVCQWIERAQANGDGLESVIERLVDTKALEAEVIMAQLIGPGPTMRAVALITSAWFNPSARIFDSGATS